MGYIGTRLTGGERDQKDCPLVEESLGQALATVVMLSATIKFEGSMILQAQGDCPFRTLVAQSTHDRKIRGLIRSLETVKPGPLEEMFGKGRLFHEEKVRLFYAEPVEFKCACSRQNLEDTLRTFSRDELGEMLREKGIIKAGCNFCNQFYQFDRIDIEKILSEKLLPKCRKSPINTGPLPIYPCRPLSGLYQRKRLTRKPRFFNKLTKPSSPSK